MQHVKAPGSVAWDDGDIEDINRIQTALILHQTPEAIDAMSVRDVALVLEIHRANAEIEAWMAAKRRKGG